MPIPKTVVEIVDIIRERVRTGEPGYRPGNQLPTYPRLAEELGSSPATVGRAIRVLRGEGVLKGVRGEGVYVPEEATDG